MGLGKTDADLEVGNELPTYRLELGKRVLSVVKMFPSKKAAAAVAGVTSEQLKSYEDGESKPPFELVVRLCRSAGVSLDWLASGDGPMLEKERLAVRSSGGLDPAIFHEAVVETEEYLRSRGIKMLPEKKWELFLAIYDVGAAVGQGNVNAERFENVIRLATGAK